ncbi:MAG TPA: LysE/ArgO family amino acid transporter [Spirochaetota bacterium]|nr:LysE/ArgO family amino acid transporter [Spirochaetota bacterium]HRX48538.1 LysE/ArgO family amino acid transporter [Spirochaetota bacterium]
MHIFNSFIQGFLMGAGLIIAIGAQNAFVLKQGIKGEHRSVVAWICALSDAVLITAGISGMGYLFTQHTLITKYTAFGGAIYLAWFSFRSFSSALKGESMEISGNGDSSITLKAAVITTLALTYLNPHVYLDTVVMLGGFGASRPSGLRPFFGLGAASASFIWFFSLAFSGRILAPLFRKKISWRILDTGIGIVMAYIAYSLVSFGLSV